MKRTAIIALALLVALTALGCNDALKVTTLNMDDYDSQFTLERDYPVNPSDYLYISISPGGLNAADPDVTIDVDFSLVSPWSSIYLDVDVIKYRTLDEFGPELKKVLKFYSYTDKGDNSSNKLIPPALSSAPLSYDVIKWENYVATLRFPSLAADVSNYLEVRLDQQTYTHHNGRKLDRNNDGVVDEYDLMALGQVPVVGTTNTGYSYDAPDFLTPYISDVGLGNSYFGYTAPLGAVPGFYNVIVNNFTFSNTGDSNNYENDLNVIFKLQKFSHTEKKWVYAEGISGTYNATIGEFRFTINAPETDVYYRVVIDNFEALKRFAGKVKFYGYYQRLYSNAFAPVSPSEIVSSIQMPKPDIVSVYVSVNPFIIIGATHDDNFRNIVATLAFSGGGMVGTAGLPDPTPYLQNKQIFLGYDGGVGFNPAIQSSWNNLVFVPVTIIPYKNLPTDAANNRWKMILPADYLKNTKNKYLFITPDYKTLGDTGGGGTIRTFGNRDNYNFVYNDNFQYEAYDLGTGF